MEEHWTQEKEKGDSQNCKEEKCHSQNRKDLDDKTYMDLLDYLRDGNPGLKNYQELPHKNPKKILMNYVIDLKSVVWKMGLKVTLAKPNNMIFWKQEGKTPFGKVLHLFDLEHPDLQQCPVALVHPMKNVEPNSNELEELQSFLISWEIIHSEATHCQCFIPLSDISGLCAYVNIPAWALGSPNVTLLVQSVNKLVGMEIYESTS
ncbi:hypothetical protein O181_018012 [Austropuccinia psidii MF-1]|uniref:Uncharacterized protein n=1 Tax=Austropuccinia psidii MF-1 TaxID=1389203 RepID=A0A9Q3C702_9BASI|nr:hypothetical protein [Austropuccinia psidii MF-1]